MDSAKMLQILDEVAELVVRPRFQALAEGDIEQKAPGDFVTIADREAEREIIARLSGLAPGALMVGEEGTYLSGKALEALPTAELAYTIDPIDGTGNFVAGRQEYGMMVAEVRKGAVTRAWIWQPEYQRSYAAEIGSGVWRNGESLVAKERDRLPVGATSKGSWRRKEMTEGIGSLVRSAFSAAFDYPNVLEGATDFVHYKSLRPWDHLPGTLMVRELGGVSRTFDGVDYTAATTGSDLIAAATPEIWQTATAALKAM